MTTMAAWMTHLVELKRRMLVAFAAFAVAGIGC